MTQHRTTDELFDMLVQTGKGITILVEGETDAEDAWFYKRWFGDQATQIDFHPQDGWTQVVTAVAELRQMCVLSNVKMPVYGIIDRDGTPADQLFALLNSQGIVRTRRYTLENHLLDPECWANVFRFIFSRAPALAQGWDDPAVVQNHIANAYRSCMKLTAYNWVLNHGFTNYRDAYNQLTAAQQQPITHPAALQNRDARAILHEIGRRLTSHDDFDAMYAERLQVLENAPFDAHEQLISGKHVLNEFHRHFPHPNGPLPILDFYIPNYMNVCSQPPSDLINIVEKIKTHAGR